MAKDCQDCFTLTEVKKAKVLQTVRPVNFSGVKQAKVFQTSLRVPLSNFSYQASAVLPRIRIQLSNLSIKFLDFAQGQVERSETWPCAKSKNFMLKFFFPPRRRSPKQPRRSAKQKLKSFCLADQLGCFRQKNLYQPCRLGQSQR